MVSVMDTQKKDFESSMQSQPFEHRDSRDSHRDPWLPHHPVWTINLTAHEQDMVCMYMYIYIPKCLYAYIYTCNNMI